MCLAIPARVVDLSPGEENRATVDVVGVRRTIDIGLLEDDPPRAGDWVLVHVGFALSKVSEREALDQIRTLNMLGETDLARQEIENSSDPSGGDS
jgi:hydrogenase expression/formation protein HypC